MKARWHAMADKLDPSRTIQDKLSMSQKFCMRRNSNGVQKASPMLLECTFTPTGSYKCRFAILSVCNLSASPIIRGPLLPHSREARGHRNAPHRILLRYCVRAGARVSNSLSDRSVQCAKSSYHDATAFMASRQGW